jgi:predicted Zn finger-like uncharacterized protein
MIIQCEGCAAKYFLPESKVPAKPTKVSCPQCKAVFTLVSQTQNVVADAKESVLTFPARVAEREPKEQKPVPAPAEQPVGEQTAKAPAKAVDKAATAAESPAAKVPERVAKKPAEKPAAKAVQEATEEPVGKSADKRAGSQAQKPAAKRGGKRKAAKSEDTDARAKRLARVLVSDILCYNQEKRDQALIDGNLMTVLGDEIKKSWELYKEKVGPEVAKSTNYFKEALNEILADGQKVF